MTASRDSPPETTQGLLKIDKETVKVDRGGLEKAFGAKNPAFIDGLAFQIVNIGSQGSKPDEKGIAYVASMLYGMHGVRALSLIQSGDTRAAARWADRAATTPGAHYLIAMIAAVANGLDGRHQQAARWRQEARRRKPDACSAQFLAAFPIRDGAARSRIAVELSRQGF